MAGGERADGDAGGSAERRLLFQQQDVRPVFSSADSGGKSAAASANHDDVEVVFHGDDRSLVAADSQPDGVCRVQGLLSDDV